jgi:P-type Cu+ transporter
VAVTQAIGLPRKEAIAMVLAEWLGAIGGLALTLGVWALFVFGRGGAHTRSDSPQLRRVRVRGGFQPAEIHLTAGIPTRLVFRREETAPCSERVVFPDYGISVGLPPFQEVAVELPASEPGTHLFTCEMDMLHGRLVVDPAATRGSASRQDIGAVAA